MTRTTPARLPVVPRRRRLLEGCRRFGRKNALAVSVSLVGLLVLGDFVTGIDLTFMLLYLVPICLAAWWRGRAAGLFVAAIATLGSAGDELAAGLARPLHAHLLRLVWNHGGAFLVFVVCVLLVVRVRAYADEETRRQRLTVEQLRQAERLGVVGQLAAGLAHELGTPLNVVMGHAEQLIGEDVSRETLDATAHTILAQAERMTSIIRNLLGFARRARSEKTEVDLGVLLRESAALLGPVARKAAVEIDVDTRDGNARLHANRTELEQVFVNLMINAIQAMPDGGMLRVSTRATVRTPRGEGPTSRPPPALACIVIADEGVGISPESLPRIFDPFFTTKDVGQGTGLGLSLSYAIVSEHGGRIEVASKLNAGTRFTVYLPLRLSGD